MRICWMLVRGIWYEIAKTRQLSILLPSLNSPKQDREQERLHTDVGRLTNSSRSLKPGYTHYVILLYFINFLSTCKKKIQPWEYSSIFLTFRQSQRQYPYKKNSYKRKIVYHPLREDLRVTYIVVTRSISSWSLHLPYWPYDTA